MHSVFTQTFEDFELLVVDDGSTDNTSAVLSELAKADTRLKRLKNQGCGLVDALNYGIASASAELIARMDADDICHPERFQRQFDFLQRHSEIAVVGTQVRFIDEHGAAMKQTITLPQSPDAIARALQTGCCLRHPTVLMRKVVLQELGGYRRQLVHAEDYDLWLRISERHALANLSDELLLYRMHAAQVSEQKEWAQRLSRNLALVAAIERRRTGADPIDRFPCFTRNNATQRCGGAGCPSCVCEILRAFETAEKVLGDHNSIVTESEFWNLLRYLSRNTMGEGQKARILVLIGLYREALRRRAPLQLAAALALALCFHPGRTLRGLTARPTVRRKY